ncbi:MAG TPA: metallophosphoesterase [Pseudonocardia sp.]|nr:metallophosphoesterase [Pseudonocardia sp.]
MRLFRYYRRVLMISAILLLLFLVPWWTLVGAPDWPTPVAVLGSVLVGLCFVGLPTLMFLGHGPRQSDAAGAVGDTLLGVTWVVFSESVLGNLAGLVLLAAGVPDPSRSRIVAVAVLGVALALAGWGVFEARRVPRVRALDVVIPRLGAGLDGLRLAVITDTHFGPLDRANWSAKVAGAVNALHPDVACHAGDLADGPVARRHRQVDPLAGVRAELGKFYITGNHEYFGEAQAWLDHMAGIGWQPLHNQHQVVCRGGDRLVIAGIDDPTGAGLPGHGPDLPAALAGTDPALPVVLLAHQPKLLAQAAEAGVALQISGHTHGGQIWPFHYLVRLDQPVLAGLSRHGAGTQLYTSRGTGFWGPPLRVFAPSEITLLTLRAPTN